MPVKFSNAKFAKTTSIQSALQQIEKIQNTMKHAKLKSAENVAGEGDFRSEIEFSVWLPSSNFRRRETATAGAVRCGCMDLFRFLR